MPHLGAREASLRGQLDALDTRAADRDAYLKLADDLEGFLARLRGCTATATTDDRRRVLRLLVKDVLIAPEKITIRHRIPVREPPTAAAATTTQPTRRVTCATVINCVGGVLSLTLANRRHASSGWGEVPLALGLRQGEALGLMWSDVDLDRGTLRIRRGRLRPRYEHGCGGTCGRKPGYCPDRKQIRPDTGDTKSRAGKRTMGLPDPLIELLGSTKCFRRPSASQLASSGTTGAGYSRNRTVAR
jgi:hypothetical protein